MNYSILHGYNMIVRRAPIDEEIESIAREANDIPDDQFVVIEESYKKDIRNRVRMIDDD